MTTSRVSVVIVSRDRLRDLRLCLLGLSQQVHPAFEIVVVTDPATAADLGDWAAQVKLAVCDDANISAARNLGIGLASGDILAFIDDDAVPEPYWLVRLTAPIAAKEAECAGGCVLGRNGISQQWGARMAGADGQSVAMDPPPSETIILAGAPGTALKTEGTNMAFRADILRDLGGFDPAFRFYLDETDLNLRIAAKGMRTAYVPQARVLHGFAPSLWRRQDRVPRTLVDIGASLAVFIRKHGDPKTLSAVRDKECSAQRKRLIEHMIAGRLLPGDVPRILASFDQGWSDGLIRPFGSANIFPPATPWLAFDPMPAGPVVRITGRWLARKKIKQQAALAVKDGQRVVAQIFSISALYHRRVFTPQGYWLQQGGVFGKSRRDDPQFKFWRLADRSAREWRENATQFHD